jgi:AraC-like DNA-binding protein
MRIDPETHRRLCRAHALLAAADAPPRGVRQVAREVGISSFHFIRLFAAVFGVTPHQLRRRARLARARQLLADGQAVTAVCLEVGFSSLGSFSSAFKARMGESPARYRQRALATRGTADLAPDAPGCLSLLAMLPAWSSAIFEKRPERPPC